MNTNQAHAQLMRSFVLQPNAGAGQCVDVVGGLPAAGAALQYNTCRVSSFSQSFVPATDKSLQVNGLCVDVPDGLAAGNIVKLAACNRSAQQRWQVTSGILATGGPIQSAGNTALCFDTSTHTSGAPVRLAACSAVAAQAFVLR